MLKKQHYNAPKKALGQHFLTDKLLAARIADAVVDEEDASVIEIGPGRGIMTERLYQRFATRLSLVEYDNALAAAHQLQYARIKDQIVNADFMDVDVRQFGENQLWVGNLPYNVGSQILIKMSENRERVSSGVFMLQKEVVDRVVAKPGSRIYGVLTFFVQAYYHAELLFDVGPEQFDPPPKVDSAVFRLTRKKDLHLPCDEKFFFSVVKNAFGQRRKMLRNSLKPLGFVEEGALLPFAQMRPEKLSIEEFVELTNLLKPTK